MQVVKLHLLLTVVATQLTALFVDGSVPYFPIEISRTAAAGPWSQRVFLAGIVSLGGTLLMEGTTNLSAIGIWLSLLVIALFDDVHHWAAHMTGVAGLAIAVATLLLRSDRRGHDLFTLSLAALIYLTRLVMKVLAVWYFESAKSSEIIDGPRSLARFAFIASSDIMYNGQGTRYTDSTLLVFRLAGVLQWVVFWLFSELLP